MYEWQIHVRLSGVDCDDDWYGESNWSVAVAAVDSVAVVDFVAFAHSPDLCYDFHGAIDEHHHRPTAVNYTHLVSINYLVDHVDSIKIKIKIQTNYYFRLFK